MFFNGCTKNRDSSVFLNYGTFFNISVYGAYYFFNRSNRFSNLNTQLLSGRFLQHNVNKIYDKSLREDPLKSRHKRLFFKDLLFARSSSILAM